MGQPEALPPITPQPNIHTQMHDLKQQWEQAMHFNHIIGRENDHITKIMQSQFQFLEYVVLDVSKQIRIVHEHLFRQEQERVKLLTTVAKLEKDLVHMQTTCNDNRNQMERLEKAIEALTTNIDSCLQKQDEKRASVEQTLVKSVEILNESLVPLSDKVEKCVHRVGSIELTLQEFHHRFKEQNEFNDAMGQFRAIAFDMIKESKGKDSPEAKLNMEIQKVKQDQLKELGQVVNVMAVLKGSIRSLREAQLNSETRLMGRIDKAVEGLKSLMYSEIKSANQSVIFSGRGP